MNATNQLHCKKNKYKLGKRNENSTVNQIDLLELIYKQHLRGFMDSMFSLALFFENTSPLRAS